MYRGCSIYMDKCIGLMSIFMEASKNVRLSLTISRELEKRFREEIFKRYGLRKGDIQRAVEEAIDRWIKEGRTPET